MKFTIEVPPMLNPFEVKRQFQDILRQDIMADITLIYIKFNKHWNWSISGQDLINWALDLGLAVSVQFPSRKKRTTYIIKRTTGQDDINKDKLLKELGLEAPPPKRPRGRPRKVVEGSDGSDA